MSERAWYRSLYWRIALGLIVFLALLLGAQGLLYIYLTDRLAGSMPARSPRELAARVASDLSAALARDPALDLFKYVHDGYDHVFQPIVVVMLDGRTVSNHETLVPEGLLALLRRQARMPARAFGRGGQQPDAAGSPVPPPPQDGGRRLGPGPRGRRADFEPIVVNGERLGLVAVPLGRPPVTMVLRELGPTMGAVAVVTLLVGGSIMAFIVFGPARRRLRHLQDATERVAAGDLGARAPEHGGDEVADLARSFNRMTSELASRAAALEQSDQARRQLLADVSHELMTPLTAMRGYIETLSMPALSADSATRERYLGIVDEETRRLEHIIGDLLDLARLEGGGPAMRMDSVSIESLFGRVAARHEREMAERRISMPRRIDPGVEIVRGDPDRLEQALQNLAGNALRYTPDGGEIALSATPRDRTIVITVRDSGPGIPEAQLPQIFDRFYKADSSRRRATSGSGLGLSIVKAIVEHHGGTISARNDGGAVFEITLPA
jgi:two-component system, OmpR family, sensor kinase